MINSLKVGGSERVMALLANELSSMPDVSVDVIVYGRGREVFYELADAVRVITPPFAFQQDRRRRSTLRTMAFLRGALARGDYDVALSFGERWNSFVMLSTLGGRVPVVLSDRSAPSLRLGRVQERLRRRLYPLAAGLMAQTESARRAAAARRLNQNIEVIPNPVRAHVASRDVERERIVVSVGRLVRTKHHERLIQVFARLRRDGWRLRIVGDDAQQQRRRAMLERVAEVEGVADVVDFVGSSDEVGRHLDASTIFASTSSVEGFPNAIAEALAAGLPVVAYDCDAGPRDLVRDGENGFLVPVFDDELFAERLRALMDDPALRDRMAAEAPRSVEQLAPSRVAKRVSEFLGACAASGAMP